MIGHFLLTLTECQEDRALTTSMRPGSYSSSKGPCLVGATLYVELDHNRSRCQQAPQLGPWLNGDYKNTVESRYDALCERFTAVRVNAAIRNRILENRARRTLQNRPASEPVLIGVVR